MEPWVRPIPFQNNHLLSKAKTSRAVAARDRTTTRMAAKSAKRKSSTNHRCNTTQRGSSRYLQCNRKLMNQRHYTFLATGNGIGPWKTYESTPATEGSARTRGRALLARRRRHGRQGAVGLIELLDEESIYERFRAEKRGVRAPHRGRCSELR
jgi:hypothetical protein